MAHSTNREIGSTFNSQSVEQQTFLGCSIVGFNVSAGFGDNTSQLTVDLVVDDFNKGDRTVLGQGQDVYHDGISDKFRPPPVGTPVFFTFGKQRARVQEAFQKSLDDYYNTSYSTVPTFDPDGNIMSGNIGHYHFSFGGILQSYTQSDSPEGGTVYSVNVVDPREILANAVLILNNYAGTTANNANLFNIYGLLEHDTLDRQLQIGFDNPSVSFKLNANGTGTDMYYGSRPNWSGSELYIKSLYTGFPITGTGMSRRNDSGIPYYRVAQALNYMMGLLEENPLNDLQKEEYANAGYGGFLYFRGLKYVVDLSDIPVLPYHYRLNYDQMSILDLVMEICEATNHDTFITLLPVINHPACLTTYRYNQNKTATPTDMVAGIIKVVTINKSVPALPGKIKEYLDSIPDPVINKDFGYELTNEPTDKFVVGGKEVKMHYFSRYQTLPPEFGMHKLEYSLNQQILPYYGTLGPKIVSIPRGMGSYQQIVLDAGGVLADGLGRYYVATEMELRAASISFEKWLEFLLLYNDIYMESVEQGDIQDLYYAQVTPGFGQILELSANYQVTVPRCVCPPHPEEDGFIGNVPKNPCSPPYGWPLYWQRATNIGVPMAGAAGFSARAGAILNNANNRAFVKNHLRSIAPQLPRNDTNINAVTNEVAKQSANIIAVADKVSRQGLNNVKIIYAFLKKVADECLGRKFLVKIPQEPNVMFNETSIEITNGITVRGPFGFMPRDVNNSPVVTIPSTLPSIAATSDMNITMLNPPPVADLFSPSLVGALKIGYNRATEEHTFNYYPESDGGWYDYKLFDADSDRNLLLMPVDDLFLKSDNGRIKPYVRFDHSHLLSLSSFPKDSYSQQFVSPDSSQYIPDLSYVMENSTDPSDKLSERAPAFQNQVTIGNRTFIPTNACAFVKVDLDTEYYFAPKIVSRTVDAYGGNVAFYNSVSQPAKVLAPGGCDMVNSYSVRRRIYRPLPGRSGSAPLLTMDLESAWNNEIIEKPKHVYALITLPDRAVPTMTSRFRDGMNMQINNTNIKHYLLLDVVRGMPGLETPAYAERSEARAINYMRMPAGARGRDIINAGDEAIKKAYEGLTYSLTNRVNIISPSPVYPDLVALPLRSEERHYGPWLSAYTNFAQIGGKMEYIYDESLTPWNYGGYGLMDKSGRLISEFGTSASLMSERGGFSLPSAPSGYTLGTYLLNLGPLITDITTKVGVDGINTTVSMNIYTASFGKLQKQKADNIKQLTRLKQKITDDRNSMIRRNMGKSQKSPNLFSQYINQLSQMSFSDRFYNSFDKGQSASMPNSFCISAITNPGNSNVAGNSAMFGTETDGANSSPPQGNITGDAPAGFDGTMMSERDAANAEAMISNDPVASDKLTGVTANVPMQNLWAPISHDSNSTLSTTSNDSLPGGSEYNDNLDQHIFYG